MALGNHVFLPDRCAADLAVLAHELTHCGQYQAWGRWRYFARGASASSASSCTAPFGVGRSPYHYRLEDGKPFEAYGMEQQGQIVEDSFRATGGAGRLAVSAAFDLADRGPRSGRAVGLIDVRCSAWARCTAPCSVVSGSLSSHSASTFPSGSATIAMMPQVCCVGSVRNRTPRSWSPPQ